MRRLFFLIPIIFIFSQISISQVSGDFRSKTSGNWNNNTSWEKYNGSSWADAGSGEYPNSSSSAFIQSGHTVTLTQNESVNDLHIAKGDGPDNTVKGIVALQSYTLELNGKLRCYYASIGTVPGTNSTSVAIFITCSSGSGKIKIVGSTRNLTSIGEWGAGSFTSNTSLYNLEISPNTDATITSNTSIKAQSWNFTSGIFSVTSGSSIHADNGTEGQGDITIGASATVISASSASDIIFTRTGSSRAGTFSLNGNLTLTGTSPKICMNSITLNGTVKYDRSGSQNLFASTDSGMEPNSYNNLTISNTGTKSLSSSISVSGILTLTSVTLNCNNFNLTLTKSGNPLSFSSGVFSTSGGGMVIYNSTSAQTISAISYPGLQVTGSRGTNSITFPADTVFVYGDFTADAAFSSGGYSLTNNKISMKTTGKTISVSSPFKFNKLKIEPGSSGTINVSSSSADVYVQDSLHLFSPSATLNLGGKNLYLKGSLTSLVYTSYNIISNGTVIFDCSNWNCNSNLAWVTFGMGSNTSITFPNLKITGTTPYKIIVTSIEHVVTGNFLYDATPGSFSNGGSNFKMTGNGSNINVPDRFWFATLYINPGAGNTVSLNSNAYMSNQLFLTDGTFNLNGFTLYNQNATPTPISRTSGDFSATGGGTFEYSYNPGLPGSVTVIGGISYPNLKITGNRNGYSVILQASSTISVYNNFTASATNCTYVNTSNTFAFRGSTAQNVNVTSSLNFNNLTINCGTGGSVMLSSDITVNGATTFTNGIIYTGTSSPYNSFKIQFGTSAVNPVESNSSRIVGVSQMNSRSVGTGAINFLSCSIASGTDNIGSVSITRKTGPCGIITYNGNQSIASNWTITAGAQPTNGRNVTYYWLSALDNGKNFSSSNKGEFWVSDDAITWIKQGSGIDVSGSDPRQMTIPTTHFSYWVASDENSPMPIKLNSFTSVIMGRNVKLKWVTTYEQNNLGFEVERKSENYDWIKAGFINGIGKKDTITTYYFVDKNLQSGKYLYRLKQIDYNGNFEYYLLKDEVIIENPLKFSLSQNYPNPFNPVTKIDYELPADVFVSLKVYDITGREIKTLVNENQKAGYYSIDFNANNLASGIYFYRLVVSGVNPSQNYTAIKKMMVIK